MTPTNIHEFFTKPKNVLLFALCAMVIYSLVSGSENFDKLFSFFTRTLETLPAATPELISPTPPETSIISG